MNWLDTLIKALIWVGVPIFLLLVVAAVVWFGFLRKTVKKMNDDFKKNNEEQNAGLNRFGKHRAKEITEREKLPTLKDVGGMSTAIEELQEILDFLHRPEKFKAIGGRIPKGVLLYGRPGVGKTLLAKAIAGETGVRFYSVAGSAFDEMLVGVGSSRVRSLLDEARKNAPCIVFFDEIDAMGSKRSASAVMGEKSSQQTLNQLLTEMDGFEDNSGVVIMAATNRYDMLDPALIRGGRFDRKIEVWEPDLPAREEILNIYLKKVKHDPALDVRKFASDTTGYVGADLESIVNEAALLAVRKGKDRVEYVDLEDAEARVSQGLARGRKQTDKEKRVIAYHEAGHAIVGLSSGVPLHLSKISIIPRGRAAGFTKFNPEDDRKLYFSKELFGVTAGFLGGYAAELLIFGDITNGASNDIEKTTELARAMVSKLGMSKKGPVSFSKGSNIFADNPGGASGACSEITARDIDEEVEGIVNKCLSVAQKLLVENRGALDELAELLIKIETVSGEEAIAILKKHSPQTENKS